MSDGDSPSNDAIVVIPTDRTLPRAYLVSKLVWPTFAWRVETTFILRRSRDPLQLSILRLASQGVKDHRQIARLLGIEPDLARHVQLKCLSINLLKPDFSVTYNAGKKLADVEDEDASEEKEHGWMFREALTGEMMPLYIVGTRRTGDPRHNQRDVLPFNQDFAIIPDSRSRSVAMRQYDRIRLFEDANEDSTGLRGDLIDPGGVHKALMLESPLIVDWQALQDDEPDGPYAQDSAPPERKKRHTRVVASRPERVGFEMLVYAEREAPDAWCVTPPMNGAGGLWYRQRLEWAADRIPAVQTLLNQVRNSDHPRRARGERLHDTVPDHTFKIDHLDGRPELARVAATWRRACDAWRLFEGGEDTGDMVIMRCQSALEELLRLAIAQTVNHAGIGRDITEMHSRARGDLAEMARNLGLEGIPNSFMGPELLRRAAVPRRHCALRDRATFLFFAAAHGYSQAFANACYTCPELFTLLAQVAQARNAQVHGDRSTPTRMVTMGPSDVMTAAKQVTEVIMPFIRVE